MRREAFKFWDLVRLILETLRYVLSITSGPWHVRDHWNPSLWKTRGPFHKRFFHRNSNLIKISFYSPPRCSELIAMKFCTWHDSFAVVACGKFCSDMVPYDGITLKSIFIEIWITMENLFVKWAPVPIHPTLTLSRLLMAWWHNKPRHQQAWYWPHFPTIFQFHYYRQVSNIRRTKSQHLKDSRTVLWQNPLKPDVKSRMKM